MPLSHGHQLKVEQEEHDEHDQHVEIDEYVEYVEERVKTSQELRMLSLSLFVQRSQSNF